MRISVIIPVFNEASCIAKTLDALTALRARGHEVLVVDGGSGDETVAIAGLLSDRVLTAPQGRALQMRAGAEAAGREIFWFLHADACPPRNADRLIVDGLRESGHHWGRFDVSLVGEHRLLPIIAALMNFRSRVSGIATGDQGIFVRREIYEKLGGFPAIPLMEDVELSRILKQAGPPLCLADKLRVSARRWESRGVLRTVLMMWFLRLSYFTGRDVDKLARRYCN